MTSARTRPWYMLPLIGLLVVAWALTGCGKEEPAPTTGANPRPGGMPEAMATGALNVCVACDQKMAADTKTVNYEYEGSVIRSCSQGCADKVKADAAKYAAKFEEMAKKRIMGN